MAQPEIVLMCDRPQVPGIDAQTIPALVIDIKAQIEQTTVNQLIDESVSIDYAGFAIYATEVELAVFALRVTGWRMSRSRPRPTAVFSHKANL